MSLFGDDIFSNCAPAQRSNLRQCGTLTSCQLSPLTQDDLNTVFADDDQFRLMWPLVEYDLTLGMCGVQQNPMYALLMANKVNMNKAFKGQSVRPLSPERIDIVPFLNVKRLSPINEEYWNVTAGTADGDNWAVTIEPTANVPTDTRQFPARLRVFINTLTDGGSESITSWEVETATDNGDGTLTLSLIDKNAGSPLGEDLMVNPTDGTLTAGTANIHGAEEYCPEDAGIINHNFYPAWIERTRNATCTKSQWAKMRNLLLSGGNAAYETFLDLSDTEKEKQHGNRYRNRWVWQFLYGQPLQHQNVRNYDQLEQIVGADFGILGTDGATCYGRRANAVGQYYLLNECGRVIDLQGAPLNLPAFFDLLYDIARNRAGTGDMPTSIDVVMNSVYAEKFHQAMIAHFNALSGNSARINIDQNAAVLGFAYRSYKLFRPAITLNVLTHLTLDDWLSAKQAANQANLGNQIWIFDWKTIYPGIINSRSSRTTTPNLKALQQISSNAACVFDVPQKTVGMFELTWTGINECPKNSAWLRNINISTVPVITDADVSYLPDSSTTTTTPA